MCMLISQRYAPLVDHALFVGASVGLNKDYQHAGSGRILCDDLAFIDSDLRGLFSHLSALTCSTWRVVVYQDGSTRLVCLINIHLPFTCRAVRIEATASSTQYPLSRHAAIRLHFLCIQHTSLLYEGSQLVLSTHSRQQEKQQVQA